MLSENTTEARLNCTSTVKKCFFFEEKATISIGPKLKDTDDPIYTPRVLPGKNKKD